MADAIISVAVDRVAAIIEDLIQQEVNLVRGAEKEARSLSSELDIIKSALDDGESRRFKDKNLNNWLTKLEHIAYEMEDVLDEWNYAILKLKFEGDRDHDHESKKKVCSFIPSSSSCLCFKKVVVHRSIAKKIKQVKGQLDELLKEKDKFKSLQFHQPANQKEHHDEHPEFSRVQSTSFIDLAKVHGRDIDMNNIVRKLLSSSDGQPELGLQILSIVGVGGLGKTTVAQQVYNDDRVKSSFELRIWVCVSDPFHEAAVAKGIIEGVSGVESCPNTNRLNVLCDKLKESISGKKFFLVLDDIWTEDQNKWEPLRDSLKCGGIGSVILVTTRNLEVAIMMGTTENDIYRLRELSDDDCWFIISQLALSWRNKEKKYEELESIGMNIAKKCKGLPLAAKTLGSVLRSKNSIEEWDNILHSEIWELGKVEVDLFPHLLLSYNELSPTLKRCFSYCAIFPKDYEIELEEIIRIWMAQGYLDFNIGKVDAKVELKGRDYFNILAMRSLFQDFKKSGWESEQIVSFKMHDIIHDFAQFLRKNSRVVEAAGMQKTNCQVCDSSLVSSVKEYRTLFCRGAELPPCLCDCRSLRTLGLVRCNMTSIPQEMEKLIHLRWLDLSGNNFSGVDTKVIYKLYNLHLLRMRNCRIQEIPREIRNLIRLRHLDVSYNEVLKELPDCICDLEELRTLNIDRCESLHALPEGIDRLKNLEHLLSGRGSQFPRGLAQLTSLRTLRRYFVGSGSSNKLAWLKNLNCLTGYLRLIIRLSGDDDLEDMVGDAREAELRKTIHIQHLRIKFETWLLHPMDEKVRSMKMERVIDALEPYPNLQSLEIYGYEGTKLPSWVSSLNKLRRIRLVRCTNISLLYSLGKLSCLEEIVIRDMQDLQFLRREFLGISSSSMSSGGGGGGGGSIITFPKLKTLTFFHCKNWKEWEDITHEEEDSITLSLMPCLTTLSIQLCPSLMALPHRLLCKLSSLEKLDISGSTQLEQRYGDKDGSAWKSISLNNPLLGR